MKRSRRIRRREKEREMIQTKGDVGRSCSLERRLSLEKVKEGESFDVQRRGWKKWEVEKREREKVRDF